MSSESESEHEPGFSTRAIHTGSWWNPTRSISPPIFQTSTFRLDNAAQGAEYCETYAPAEYYTRWGNPTLKQVEAVIAALEHTEEALVFSSGMGAIGSTMLALLSAGDHVIVGKSIYAGVLEIAGGVLGKFGVSYSAVDSSSIDAVRQAIRPETKLIVAESPTNPTLEICDLAGLGALGKESGVLTMVDNTFATPYNQNPADEGIDIVCHAATKALGGHSDITAGVICSRREIVEKSWKYLKLFGACLSPFEGWLLLRGLKTLALRMERQNASALAIAEFLEEQPRVKRVHYPGLASHPDHAVAKRQMRGFGGIVSAELDASVEDGARFAESLQLFQLAVSLGGAESLIQHPATMTHGTWSDEERQAAGIGDGLLRLSIGLEEADDLISDLRRSLQRIDD